MKIRTKILFTLIFSFVLSITIVGFITNYFLLEKTKESTFEQLKAISEIQEARIDQDINSNFERLDSVLSRTQLRLSLSEYLNNNSSEDFTKLNSIINDALFSVDDFQSITVFSTDGREITSVYKPGEKIHSEPFFKEALTSKLFKIEGDNHKPVFYFAGPLNLSGELLGTITIEIKASSIVAISQDDSGLGETGELILAKRDDFGNALFISPSRFDENAAFSRVIPKESDEIPINQALLFNEKELMDVQDYRGEKVLAITNYIESADWALVSKIDSAEVYSTFYETNIIQFGFVIILSGIMASLSILFADHILKPIINLKKIVGQMEIGKFDSKIEVKGNNEICSLAQAFDNLQDVLHKNQKVTERVQERLRQKLKERNDLKNALDNSSYVLVTDKSGAITYVNQKILDISKYEELELIGQNHKILRSEFHSENFFKEIRETTTSGKVWRGIIKNKAKDGTFFWTDTTITPFLDADGIPEQYISVSSDVTELMEQKELIQTQYRQLKLVDTQKEEFTSMVSHELKTPITPIKFNTEMLLEPGVLGDLNNDQTDAIKEIEINAARLENLISDILYAQKLDMNKMVFNKKRFNCSQLLERVSKNLYPLLKEKSIKLEIVESVGEIVSDDDRIQQILENLIKNSIDFVPESGGKITIGCKKIGEEVVFYVKDNGIGIPKDKQSNLFKKFYQVDTTHTRKHGGTGLGLVICKGFAEGLNGKIWCESDKGEGAKFFFSIPLTQEIEVKT